VVVASLAVGGGVGIVLSGAFLWLEVGRYAAPQVPVTVFDERKVFAAYTVGLFVGVPIAVAYYLLVYSLVSGGLFGTALGLVGVVAGAELAQRYLVRSRYWGGRADVPFHAVSLRAGIGGILALTVVALYLGTPGTLTALGVVTAVLTAVALVALEVAGGLLSLRYQGSNVSRVGGPVPSAVFSAVAFFLLGIGSVAGLTGALGAPIVVLAGSLLAYRGRRAILADVPPPTGAPAPLTGARPLPFGRTTAGPKDDRAAETRRP